MTDTTDTTTRALRFDPPGPGPWLLDACHVPRPWTRFQQEIHAPSLGAGFRAMSRRYGLLVDDLNWNFVNGFAYYFPSPPPEPEIPERFAAAERAFAERIWREDRDRWDRSLKPAAVAAWWPTPLLFPLLGPLRGGGEGSGTTGFMAEASKGRLKLPLLGP